MHFVLWSSHTALTLEEKKVLTIQMIQQNPDFGVKFGIELLRKTSLIRGHRRGKKERPAQLILEQELLKLTMKSHELFIVQHYRRNGLGK
mgnify:CR=1 FL=1